MAEIFVRILKRDPSSYLNAPDDFRFDVMSVRRWRERVLRDGET